MIKHYKKGKYERTTQPKSNTAFEVKRTPQELADFVFEVIIKKRLISHYIVSVNPCRNCHLFVFP